MLKMAGFLLAAGAAVAAFGSDEARSVTLGITPYERARRRQEEPKPFRMPSFSNEGGKFLCCDGEELRINHSKAVPKRNGTGTEMVYDVLPKRHQDQYDPNATGYYLKDGAPWYGSW